MSGSNHQSVSISGGGLGGTLLTGLFVVLKVMGYIDWSWWWVFAPLWIPFLIVLFTCVLLLVAAMIASK